MKPTIATGPEARTVISVAEYRAARDFRALRLQVFGRGTMAELAAAAYLGCSHRSLQRYEAGHTLVPHAAVLALRERLREAVAA